MEMANFGCNGGPLALPGCSLPKVTCSVATPSVVPHFGRPDLLTREDSPLLPIHGLVLVSVPPSLALVWNDSRSFGTLTLLRTCGTKHMKGRKELPQA